jgi:hypothetical protein
MIMGRAAVPAGHSGRTGHAWAPHGLGTGAGPHGHAGRAPTGTGAGPHGRGTATHGQAGRARRERGEGPSRAKAASPRSAALGCTMPAAVIAERVSGGVTPRPPFPPGAHEAIPAEDVQSHSRRGRT